MSLERERKQTEKVTKDGSKWKSGNRSTKIKGYGQQVLDHHKKELNRAKKRVMKNNAAGTLTNMGAGNKENKVLKVQNPNQNNIPKPSTASTPHIDDAEYPEVMEFLGSIKLMKYKSVFLENGFEDIETILELNEDHLGTLGIPLGHKLKIVKRIKELRDQQDGGSGGIQAKPEPEIVQDANMGTSCATDAMSNDIIAQQPKLSDMVDPTHAIMTQNNESMGVATDPMTNDEEYPDMCGVEVSTDPKPSQNMTTSTDIQTQSNTESSKIEEQKQFAQPDGKPKPKIVKFNDIKGEIRQKTKPQTTEMSIGTQDDDLPTMLDGCKVGAKESCWQCYRLEIIDDMLSIEGMPNKLF